MWGDGLKYAPEQCDDGNSESNDGWSSNCTKEDYFTWSGGNLTTKDTCIDYCGDGFQYK